jgi:hypothetical protein
MSARQVCQAEAEAIKVEHPSLGDVGSNRQEASMRMIVVLAVAFVTFAGTLPVAAQQSVSKRCAALRTIAGKNAAKVCGQGNFDAWLQGIQRELDSGITLAELRHFEVESVRDEAVMGDPDLFCYEALLKWYDACDVPNTGGKTISKYKTPAASPRDPRSPPSAGLLETTPGLSPQGPSATGTPSGIPNRNKGN